MRLAKALGVHKGDLVAFVGAGGKSSAMRCLAAELSGDGWRVAVTTTTRIRAAEGKSYPALVVGHGLEELLARGRAALQDGGCVALALERPEARSKLGGLPESWPQALLDIADVVLVEADGARGASLKAPAPHEPAMPQGATLVVSLAGLDILGERIDSPMVHRSELVSALLGARPEDAIGPRELAQVIAHPDGMAKGVAAGARLIPLLNKADDQARLEAGRQVAFQVKGERAIEAVLLAALQTDDPVLERWESAAAVILAAGEAERYGEPKQLLPLAGRPMLAHVVEAALASPLEQVVVVLGARADQVEAALEAYRGVERLQVVRNACWQAGMSTSMRAGLEALPGTTAVALLMLGDQPFVSPGLIERLLLCRAQTLAPVVAPAHQRRWRNPVLFHRSLFGELGAIRGDEGGRSVVRRHEGELALVDMPADETFWDVDTPEDYGRAVKALEPDQE